MPKERCSWTMSFWIFELTPFLFLFLCMEGGNAHSLFFLRNVVHTEHITQVNSNKITVGFSHSQDMVISLYVDIPNDLNWLWHSINLLDCLPMWSPSCLSEDHPAVIQSYQETDILTVLGTLSGGGHKQEINVTVQFIKQWINTKQQL